ncbi:MAG: N-acetylglucosaminyl-diphospho-decaprenol L-rhamnosyltransferase [Microbacteriaceae bacterium]|jgi:GT2 family glycosyltransferase|nr:N-acetylglucosaminyl-diphospho-decaprenol L-rhamnosyltransferase [Microbacteriaceae bacterium]
MEQEAHDAAPAEFGSLAVVVVSYGSSALLERNLTPLSRAIPGVVIVVVDNFTDDVERLRVTELGRRESWEVVLPASNTGFGVGMNLGVARAGELGASSFLLLNPDATIAADQVLRLLERVRERPLALVSPLIVRPDGSVWFDGSDLYLDDGRIRATRRRDPASGVRIESWLSGACLMVTDRLWRLVGGFSDEYFLYWEDVDLSHRVVQAGGTIEIRADAVAVHAEGGTQGEGLSSAGAAKSGSYYYYNIRNRLLFAARHLPPEDQRRWSRATVPVAYEILLQGGRRQFIRSLRPLIAAYRGIRDGRRIVRAELRVRVTRRSARNVP